MTMFKNKKILIAVFLVALLLGYQAYDSYFSLPFTPKNPAVTQEGEEAKPRFEKFNVLILGVDGRKGVNSRSDTIILASLDGETKTAQLLSVPRDTRVKIKGAWDKINAAYAYGGVDLTKKTVSDFLGVKIDRYAVINFKSLIELVDLVGGIEIDVPVRMYVPDEGIDLKPGKQHLNGEQVLAYSRFRGTKDGDIDRAKRQQEVIKLLAQKLLDTGNIRKIPELFAVVKDNVETDLTVKEMIALSRLAPDVLENGITSKVLPGRNKKIDGLWYWEPELASLDDILAIPNKTTLAASKNKSQDS